MLAVDLRLYNPEEHWVLEETRPNATAIHAAIAAVVDPCLDSQVEVLVILAFRIEDGSRLVPEPARIATPSTRQLPGCLGCVFQPVMSLPLKSGMKPSTMGAEPPFGSSAFTLAMMLHLGRAALSLATPLSVTAVPFRFSSARFFKPARCSSPASVTRVCRDEIAQAEQALEVNQPLVGQLRVVQAQTLQPGHPLEMDQPAPVNLLLVERQIFQVSQLLQMLQSGIGHLRTADLQQP